MFKILPISIFLIACIVSLTKGENPRLRNYLYSQGYGEQPDGPYFRPHHHHHHHDPYELQYYGVPIRRQLYSAGGGFNANINQNNEFSPSFGNMGDIGAQGRAIEHLKNLHDHRNHHHHHSKLHPVEVYGTGESLQYRGREPLLYRSRDKQLYSTGGGFNANVNQNNEFSPSFGNIGDLGAIKGRAGGRKGAIKPKTDIFGRAYDDDDDSSEEHHKSSKKSSKKRSRRRKDSQLKSTGGGFNANVNQNNEFSPSFGNIGDLGAMKGRGLEELIGRAKRRKKDSEESDAQLHSTAGGYNANINQNNEFSPSFGNIGDLGAMKGRAYSNEADPGERRKSSKRNKYDDDQYNAQLHSTYGGFNANINQNNEFSPSFGNIGDLGAIKGRRSKSETDGSILSSYIDSMNENDLAKYIYYFIKFFSEAAFPKHKNSAQAHKPEYFFDFRQIFLPNDNSASSSEEELDHNEEQTVYGSYLTE
uniref:Uncharacterized protein n=1 Tax=Strigamia maritima TaxID=126957 RepID=T1IS47_STRMM